MALHRITSLESESFQIKIATALPTVKHSHNTQTYTSASFRYNVIFEGYDFEFIANQFGSHVLCKLCVSDAKKIARYIVKSTADRCFEIRTIQATTNEILTFDAKFFGAHVVSICRTYDHNPNLKSLYIVRWDPTSKDQKVFVDHRHYDGGKLIPRILIYSWQETNSDAAAAFDLGLFMLKLVSQENDSIYSKYM